MADEEQDQGRQASAFHKMQDHYSEVLLNYLDHPETPGLLDARRLGATALDQGLGLAEMAELHHEALRTFLSTREKSLGMRAAGTFFAASLLPYVARHVQCAETTAALRYMNRRLESQAVRVAHAIYDEPLQLVAATYLALSQIAAKDPGDEQRFLAVADVLNRLEVQLSALSQELHPCVLDHLGLDAAAHWLAGYFRKVTATDVTVESSAKLPLSAPSARVMYRAIQETLSNIASHAHAGKIHIKVEQEGPVITCAIRDDGTGFDESAGLLAAGDRGLWLLGIREGVRTYGGEIAVKSSPDAGTEVNIVVPVAERQPNN